MRTSPEEVGKVHYSPLIWFSAFHTDISYNYTIWHSPYNTIAALHITQDSRFERMSAPAQLLSMRRSIYRSSNRSETERASERERETERWNETKHKKKIAEKFTSTSHDSSRKTSFPRNVWDYYDLVSIADRGYRVFVDRRHQMFAIFVQLTSPCERNAKHLIF